MTTDYCQHVFSIVGFDCVQSAPISVNGDDSGARPLFPYPQEQVTEVRMRCGKCRFVTTLSHLVDVFNRMALDPERAALGLYSRKVHVANEIMYAQFVAAHSNTQYVGKAVEWPDANISVESKVLEPFSSCRHSFVVESFEYDGDSGELVDIRIRCVHCNVPTTVSRFTKDLLHVYEAVQKRANDLYILNGKSDIDRKWKEFMDEWGARHCN